MQAPGYRIIVQLDPISEYAGESKLIQKTQQAIEAETYGRHEGVIVDMGEFCYRDKCPAPWCKVGDRILFTKYAGEYYKPKDSDVDYRVINDLDVLIILN